VALAAAAALAAAVAETPRSRMGPGQMLTNS
jgi:hypothetical protein